MSAEFSSDNPELYRRALAQWQAKAARSGKSLPELTAQQQLERELQIYKMALELQREELQALEKNLTELSQHKHQQLEALRTSTRILEASQAIAHVGGVEMDVATRSIYWTAETY